MRHRRRRMGGRATACLRSLSRHHLLADIRKEHIFVFVQHFHVEFVFQSFSLCRIFAFSHPLALNCKRVALEIQHLFLDGSLFFEAHQIKVSISFVPRSDF
jgi:hypothetical protein